MTRNFAVGQGETLDLSSATPSRPEPPALTYDLSGDQPAMVQVTYEIDAADRTAFVKSIRAFSKGRLRDGAPRWRVHQSVEDPSVWVETFFLPRWAEHLEQHSRLTRHDETLLAEVNKFDRSSEGPKVRHHLSSSG